MNISLTYIYIYRVDKVYQIKSRTFIIYIYVLNAFSYILKRPSYARGDLPQEINWVIKRLLLLFDDDDDDMSDDDTETDGNTTVFVSHHRREMRQESETFRNRMGLLLDLYIIEDNII